jgi:quercetin dioxygenase-like cupin family protein
MPVPHHHVGFDEVLHGISGRLRMMVDGQMIDVSAGESLLIQGGEVHAFANPFEEIARVLCVLTPGVFGVQYFREIRELLAHGAPPDPTRAAEIMMRHGLVPVKPA